MERFNQKIDKAPGHGPNGDCWQWTAAIKENGYGVFSVGGRPANGGRMEQAHRFAYELANGPIPTGLEVRHSCHNRACVNPAHLSLGTHASNMEDMTTAGRHGNQQLTHCAKGHPFDEANTILHPKKGRICRTCRKQSNLDHYYRVRREKELHPKPPVTHCPKGHEYTPSNTYVSPKGHRHCNTCRRARAAARTSASSSGSVSPPGQGD